MTGKLHSVVLDAADIAGLAAFYRDLGGLAEHYTGDDWMMLGEVCYCRKEGIHQSLY